MDADTLIEHFTIQTPYAWFYREGAVYLIHGMKFRVKTVRQASILVTFA